MGQKTHPIGLRVGYYRKWTSSWYGNLKEKSTYDKSLTNQTYQTQGVIASRGGTYYSGLEEIAINRFKRYSFTKFSNTTQLIPIDFRFFKGIGGHIYGFILYIKIVPRRLKL
jgi:hypothetical protein